MAKKPPIKTPTHASQEELQGLLDALKAMKRGDFSVRLEEGTAGIYGEVVSAFNDVATLQETMCDEIVRVGRVVGREGQMTERAEMSHAEGAWQTSIESVNGLIGDLVQPVNEVARVINAVAQGDLSQKMAFEIEGRPIKGEFKQIGTTVNTMVEQLNTFANEVTRVATEVGTEGKLGGQAEVRGVSGTWKDLTDNVNQLAGNLTVQLRDVSKGRNGDRQRRPLPEDHRRRQGRDSPDQERHQPDGRPAVDLRQRGHPRGPRSGHGR